MKVHTNPDHHTVTVVLDAEAGVDNPGNHHQNATTAQDTEEPEDPSLPGKRTTIKTMKRRWEHHALLAEFTALPYPKDSNYPMISRNMMDLRSHSHGSQIIYKQSEYSKETAMQSLQLHLTGAARSWLGKLERETIGSWDELTRQVTSNFQSTYKQPTSIEEVKAWTQQRNETLRSYIQRWIIIKNSVVDVSDERAIDAFTVGLRRADLVKEMGRIKPKIVSELMDIATDSRTAEMLVITKGHDHLKTTEETCIAIRGEDPATMITTAPIVK
jgi:hypothetical protein